MFQFHTNIVKKYFGRIDKFVKIRVFTPEEVTQIITESNIENKIQYMALVVNASVVNYNEEILSKTTSSSATEELYKLCVEVNPSMDINNILIQTNEEESVIHLIEHKKESKPSINEDLNNIELHLQTRIIGQDNAIKSISNSLKRSFVGLRDTTRPIATFFFVGQTGVGKTAIAKELTEFLYHDPTHLLRIDCSEYAMPHEYSKLIGSPPGYVGYEHSGILSEQMLSSPDKIVLFDEIEKSDRKIHDLLLQLTDEGFITDNKGRKIEFSKAIIILTSNVGSSEVERLKNRIGFEFTTVNKSAIFYETLDAIKDRFPPEFINRLTEIVLFNPIGLHECEKIALIFMDQIKVNARNVPLEIEYESSVANFIATRGYKPEFGARELRRTVEREIETPLSQMILDRKIKRGDHVIIRVKNDSILFQNN